MTSSISTDVDSPVTQLLDNKYKDGTPVVKKLNWSETCKDCERRGIPETCTHISRMSHPWIVKARTNPAQAHHNTSRAGPARSAWRR
jgi:hypothetical protein